MAVNRGDYPAGLEAALSEMAVGDIVGRIWRKDHTLWKPEPAEIAERLGWLNVTDWLKEQLPRLDAFGGEVRRAGFRHAVILGMGGSSLCAETLRQVFGSRRGHPEVIVLDSTLPAVVRGVAEKIEPEKTLFVVASKSGTTTEPLCLFQYFHKLVQSASGNAGDNFIAITDPGTPLAALAEEQRFRHIFLNPADIGGRYSVLSYFGMVPAAIMGINIPRLIERANTMRERCRENSSHNTGGYLGTVMGTLALKGRDKLTIVTSPPIQGFGLWVEQLIAESTGKEGKGIVPVVGEPKLELEYYSDDRLFIYIRLKDSAGAETDNWIKQLEDSGRPAVTLEMEDSYDLGAEFFRWEFATAVAGAVLGINPFDQPNVQSAKKATEDTLQDYQRTGKLALAEVDKSEDSFLSGAGEGDYLAVLAYLPQSGETDKVLTGFRLRVARKYKIATMAGYGPRYLHSTGQLHKGGANKGHFILVTADHGSDLPIPGRPYTFGVLADAQAVGDAQALRSSGRHLSGLRLSRDAAALARALSEFA
jgi:glucose-6-phosphate isomerase